MDILRGSSHTFMGQECLMNPLEHLLGARDNELQQKGFFSPSLFF